MVALVKGRNQLAIEGQRLTALVSRRGAVADDGSEKRVVDVGKVAYE